MKYLFVGDVHNHKYMFKDVERLDAQYNFDKIVFVGDYVDDWNTTNHESLETLEIDFDVIDFIQSNGSKYDYNKIINVNGRIMSVRSYLYSLTSNEVREYFNIEEPKNNIIRNRCILHRFFC